MQSRVSTRIPQNGQIFHAQIWRLHTYLDINIRARVNMLKHYFIAPHCPHIAASLALAASPVSAKAQESPQDPIRVGVIDTDASHLSDSKRGVRVEKRSFLADGMREGSHKTLTYEEHGADVMSAFVEQSRAISPSRPITIYSAIAFYRSGDNRIDDQNNRPMKIDMEAATKALDWFKENGVRTVVTAFVAPDSKGMRNFMDHARELGLVVFSATNNARSTYEPFPARHPDAISVTGNGRNLDFDTNSAMQKWVMFQSDSNIPGKTMTVWPENGSSYAVSRVAAFGAYMIDRDPTIGRDALVEALKQV